MLKRVLVAACVGSMALPLGAQQPDAQCAPGTSVTNVNYYTSDACQKAIDLFKYMAPQLGISLTGGNALLGTGGTVGGLGHFRLEARANGLWGSVPQVQNSNVQPQAGPYVSSRYSTKSQVLGLPAVNAEIGLFKGLNLGITRVGGIDALVTASYVPDVNASGVSVTTTGSNLKFGGGARIGLLEEGLLWPGVGFTYMRRDLPTINVVGSVPTPPGTTSLRVDNLDESTRAWRLVASKNLLLLDVAAGVGQDKYESSADVSATVNFAGAQGSRAPVKMSQTLTRTNYFADLTLNLLVLKLIGEIGMVKGGTINTYNTFDKKPDASRLFGSVGLRFDFPPF